MNARRIELPGQSRFFGGALLAVSAVLAIFLTGLLARAFLDAGLSWRCPSMVVLGLPCPSCGTTRALAALSQLHFLDALRLNPLLVLGLAALMLAPFLEFSRQTFDRPRTWLVVGAMIGLNWLYLLLFLPR
jgi:hypothetical protein